MNFVVCMGISMVLSMVITCSFNQPFLRVVHKTGSYGV